MTQPSKEISIKTLRSALAICFAIDIVSMAMLNAPVFTVDDLVALAGKMAAQASVIFVAAILASWHGIETLCRFRQLG